MSHFAVTVPRMLLSRRWSRAVLWLFLASGCAGQSTPTGTAATASAPAADPLPSWNDGVAKTSIIAFHQAIGRRPIAAFGNSDGDFEMLEWTTSGTGPRFGLIVHHTDAAREWAYDRESHIGRLARGLDEAPKRGWVLADMKNDWKVIYPFQK